MIDHKIDRRVQRTEELLRQALIALILEKGYDAITIQDILDRANMGRSTFYAHYRDKEELLLSGFQVLFDSFQQEYLQMAAPTGDPAQAGRQLSLFFFRHAGTHRALFKAMIGEQGGKIIQEHTLQYLTQFIRAHLAPQLSDRQKSFPLEVLAHYIASSYLALLSWWLNHDLPYSAEQMDAFYQQLVFPGVREILAGGR
ncbi:MAG: TetR/AcrR family transcriptional regulator [Anaerolineaceae bacterium]|nr:TetR/AcrR family transcriptional regulator [Anaerolineaceae bacterium]